MDNKDAKEFDFERKHEEDLQRIRGFRLLDDDFMSKVFEDTTVASLMQMSQNRMKNMKNCANRMLFLLQKMI